MNVSCRVENVVVTATRHPGCVNARFRLYAVEQGDKYAAAKWERYARKWSWPNLRSAAVRYLPEGTEMKHKKPANPSPLPRHLFPVFRHDS